MVKINPVTGRHAVSSASVLNKTTPGGPDNPKKSENDVVSISEEGKKKHSLGQLMAWISRQGGAKTAKTDVDR